MIYKKQIIITATLLLIGLSNVSSRIPKSLKTSSSLKMPSKAHGTGC